MENCEFLPLNSEEDTRTFVEGETVCIRPGRITNTVKAKYIRPERDSETGKITHHFVQAASFLDREPFLVFHTTVGKYISKAIPRAAATSIGQKQNLPPEVDTQIKSFFGGKSRRKLRRRRKTRKNLVTLKRK